MLRASIEYSGTDADLSGISEGAKAGDAGIEHGELLTTFADAAVRGDAAELASARDALREAAGSAVLVDAAAVVGNFERMVRIADGTGIPLDGVVTALSSDIRDDLGLEGYRSRRLTRSGDSRQCVRPGASRHRCNRPARRGSARPAASLDVRRVYSSRTHR